MPAKKSVTSKSKAKKKIAPVTRTKSAVKNTPLPKVAKKVAAITITESMVAKRAFEIACGGTGGNELDNWYRAERELKAGL